jgi:hypothetical protein
MLFAPIRGTHQLAEEHFESVAEAGSNLGLLAVTSLPKVAYRWPGGCGWVRSVGSYFKRVDGPFARANLNCSAGTCIASQGYDERLYRSSGRQRPNRADTR